MNSKPDVSVSIIVPTFNRPDLLLLSVRSAIAALPEGGEIIVADDRSKPSAELSLSSIEHPALRVCVNTGAQGAAANRAYAVHQAKGELVVFLDDDDLIFPDYPACIVAYAQSNPDAAWGFSPTVEHEREAPSLPNADTSLNDFTSLDGFPLKRQMAGLGCGFWVRRKHFLDVGGFDETLTVNEDTDFCLRLLAQGLIPHRASAPGVSLLRLPDSGLTTGTSAKERMRCFRAILDQHEDFLIQRPSGHRHLLRRFLKFAAKSRNMGAGIKAGMMEGAVKYRPGNILYFILNFLIYRFGGRA